MTLVLYSLFKYLKKINKKKKKKKYFRPNQKIIKFLDKDSIWI
jgi:hypothetical protein